MYKTKSPVLLLVFNRLQPLKRVLEAIAAVQPLNIYIAGDGARKNKDGEDARVAEVRTYLKDNINWECEIRTFYQEENLGCRLGVSGGINWFFQHVESGIILEDDCLPNEDFFKYCDLLLEKYKDDERIMHVGGTNYQQGVKRGNASYYYSKLCHVWGWATWKRSWQQYDLQMKNLEEIVKRKMFNSTGLEQKFIKRWIENFESVKAGEIDTWDYQWVYSVWANGGLSIIPNTNVIENIGFNEDATHTKHADSIYASMAVGKIGEIVSPAFVMADTDADNFSSKLEYDQSSLSLKMKRKIKSILAK